GQAAPRRCRRGAEPHARALRGGHHHRLATRQGADAAQGAQAPGRPLPAVRHYARRRLLQGSPDHVLPKGADGRPGAQGPPPLAATQVKEPHVPDVGDTAPSFELQNQDGETVKLSDFAGKTVVLYFYPKADTPGCTTQACGIRDRSGEYEKAGAVVL